MISLPYGHDHVTLRMPAERTWDQLVYRGADMLPFNASALIRGALKEPIGSPSLAEIAEGRESAVILISDSTRLCPSELILPVLLQELERGGLANDRITVVVALGMHRKQTEEELIRLVGEDVFRRVRVVNHSAQPEDCVYIGTTSRGTPVEINRRVAAADLRIATGNIEPHALVGVSGGVKSLVPGVASRTTIEHNHALSQSHKAHPGDPDNPLHRDLEEAACLLPIDFLFNVIVNHRREPLAAFAGSVAEAHKAGVVHARSIFLISVQKEYDIVIASPGGHPKDTQLYQAIKTLKNASSVTRPGGSIVLAARCQELFGNGTFQYWIETMPDRETMVSKLKEQFVLGAHKVEHLDELLRRHRIYIYSDIPKPIVDLTGMIPIDNLDEAVAALLAEEPEAQTAVMPYGGLTYPYKL